MEVWVGSKGILSFYFVVFFFQLLFLFPASLFFFFFSSSLFGLIGKKGGKSGLSKKKGAGISFQVDFLPSLSREEGAELFASALQDQSFRRSWAV